MGLEKATLAERGGKGGGVEMWRCGCGVGVVWVWCGCQCLKCGREGEERRERGKE